MFYDFDETELRHRLETMTMEEATLGSDEPEALLRDLMGEGVATQGDGAGDAYDLSDVDQLDDLLRIWRAANGSAHGLDFRFASNVSDEGFNSLIILSRQGDGSVRECVEVRLLGFGVEKTGMTDGVVRIAEAVRAAVTARA